MQMIMVIMEMIIMNMIRLTKTWKLQCSQKKSEMIILTKHENDNVNKYENDNGNKNMKMIMVTKRWRL